MSKFHRRPFAMGNTEQPVVSQPVLRGSVAKDASGEFPALAIPSELAIETEDAATLGGISAVFTVDTSMVEVLVAINAALAGYAVASETEGCLLIATTGSGEGSYVRIMPPVSGFSDASAVFGFEVYPHPLATVEAGDLLDAPVRPRQQINPLGTKHIATGEDRVGASYNRAVNMLGRNSDLLLTWLMRSTAKLVKLVIDETTHAAQLTYGIDGTLEQVDLSDLSVFDAALAGKRLCVGGTLGLTRNSTLTDISRIYSVTDNELREIPAADRTVRVGCVSRGQRTAVLPTFADDVSAPTSPLGNTSALTPDGLNALGVNRAKHSAVAISEIRQRTAIVCSGATFVTNGVAAGDVVVVAGASVNSPFNHNGTYLVETVVTEEELVLKPVDTTQDAQELNPATGVFGTAVVYSGGEWEKDIWISFYPPMPRMPESGQFMLAIPVESPLGEMSLADLVDWEARTGCAVDGWSQQHLWKGLNLDGVYQGMPGARGGGFFGSSTHRPFRLDKERAATLAAGTVLRSSTGTAVLYTDTRRLVAAASDEFQQDDVGRTVRLNNATVPFITDEPWVITRWIDGRTVELAPPLFRSGYRGAAGASITVTSWSVMDEEALEIVGMMHLVTPEYFGDTNVEAGHGGYLFSKEQRDTTTVDPPKPGLFSFLHLERIRQHAVSGNVTLVAAGPLAADNIIPLPFAPEASSNFFGSSYETKTGGAHGSVTFVRLLNGANAGLYRVQALRDGSVSVDGVEVAGIDGSTVVFTPEASVTVCFYNAKMAVSAPALGGPGAATEVLSALSLFEDAHETGAIGALTLRVGWRGQGAGIYGYINDPEFIAYDNGDDAQGYFLDVSVYGHAGGYSFYAEGATSGDDERRSARAGTTWGNSQSLDLALVVDAVEIGKAVSTWVPNAWSHWVQQSGKDPGLMVIRSATANPGTTYLYPSAAAVVIRAEGPATGIWGGIDMTGSIYQRYYAGHEGAIYSERGLGAAFWVRPLYPINLPLPDEALGGFFDYYSILPGWAATLGSAGQLFPYSASSPVIPGTTSSPDFARFNVPHIGIVSVVGAAELNHWELQATQLIGLCIDVTGTATRDGQYVIVAAEVDGMASSGWFAVEDTGETDPAWAGNEAATAIRVLGKRWFHGHVDIADWQQIGTQLESDRTLVPAVTLGEAYENRVDRKNGVILVGTPDLRTEAALSTLLFYPNADGEGPGLRTVLSGMPNFFGVIPGAFLAGWGGDGIYDSGWCEDTEQPRAAFPNWGVISQGDGTLTATTCGSLLIDDFAMEVVTQLTPHGPILYFNPLYGGSLAVHTAWANIGVPPVLEDTVRVWMRGTQGLPTALYALRGNVILYMGAGEVKTFVLALRLSDGTLLASHSFTETSAGAPLELSYDFQLCDLVHTAFDTLSESLLAQGVHLTLDIPGIDNGAFLTTGAFILRMNLEQISRPEQHVGHLDVVGMVRAHEFRHVSPVRGFQTVTPLEVELLNPADFARCMGHTTSEATMYSYGTVEGHGVGLVVDVTSGPAYDKFMRPTFSLERFFRKGPHAATITVFHPYYDPLWYMLSTDYTGGPLLSTSLPNLDHVVLPSKTGFLVPLDPPHGSRLATLHFGLSFCPAMTKDYTGMVVRSSFQVWRDLPAPLADPYTTYDHWTDVSDWNGELGVKVRLWRFNAIDFDVDMEDNYPGTDTPEHGYSECIWEGDVDLSGVTPPSPGDNPADASAQAGMGHHYSTEHFHRGAVDLLTASVGKVADFIADRRHYGYFVTIEFYAGIRKYDASPPVPYGVANAWTYDVDAEYMEEDTSTPNYPVIYTTQHSFRGMQQAYPLNIKDPDIPAMVKFRGARLGWTTDKTNDGWG